MTQYNLDITLVDDPGITRIEFADGQVLELDTIEYGSSLNDIAISISSEYPIPEGTIGDDLTKIKAVQGLEYAKRVTEKLNEMTGVKISQHVASRVAEIINNEYEALIKKSEGVSESPTTPELTPEPSPTEM